MMHIPVKTHANLGRTAHYSGQNGTISVIAA